MVDTTFGDHVVGITFMFQTTLLLSIGCTIDGVGHYDIRKSNNIAMYTFMTLQC